MGTLPPPVSRSRRPPRPARGRMIRVRVSDEEYATLAEKSAAVGDMSKFLRDHLGKTQIRHREDERRRLAMLNRIDAKAYEFTQRPATVERWPCAAPP